MKVGYVGLGAMGQALAGRLCTQSDVLVWDINPEAMTAAATAGATPAQSLQSLGQCCDLVFLCLPRSEHVQQVLFGENGLEPVLAAGSIVVDQTSGDANQTREFARRLAPRQIGLLDAPVAGGVPSAMAGQITVMTSGAKSLYECVKPILATMTERAFFCSEQVGDAQSLKAINNMVNSGNRLATMEVLGVARHVGWSTPDVSELLNSGQGQSFITQRLLPAILEQRSSTDFAIALMLKDLKQALQLSTHLALATPIAECTRALFQAALNQIGAEGRLDDLVPHMEAVLEISFSTTTPTTAMSASSRVSGDLIDGLMSTCNRLVMLEQIAVILGVGLNPAHVGPVILSGSAASHEAGRLFEAVNGGTTSFWPSFAATLELLDEGIGRVAKQGLQLSMIHQVRSYCSHLAQKFGADSTVEAVITDRMP